MLETVMTLLKTSLSAAAVVLFGLSLPSYAQSDASQSAEVTESTAVVDNESAASAESTESTEATAEITAETTAEGTEPETAVELMAEREYDKVEPADAEGVFIGLRIGALDSMNFTVKSQVDPGEDEYTGTTTGLRVGYLLGKWRTYFEYNPKAELTAGDAEIDLSSYVLATDYAIWRSDARAHRVSVGAYASDNKVNYKVTGNSGVSKFEATGLDYGLSAAYRWDILDWVFIGADARYGLNSVSSNRGDEDVNVDGIEANEQLQFNLELGVYF
jgi:hypothetical protein